LISPSENFLSGVNNQFNAAFLIRQSSGTQLSGFHTRITHQFKSGAGLILQLLYSFNNACSSFFNCSAVFSFSQSLIRGGTAFRANGLEDFGDTSQAITFAHQTSNQLITQYGFVVLYQYGSV
jgi:hypothetical protein